MASPTSTSSSLPPPIVTTPRLIIRPYHIQDIPSTHAAASPPSIHKYMSLAFAYPYTLDQATSWVKMNAEPPFHHFVICEKGAEDVGIGGIGAKPGTDASSHSAEIGYWISEAHQGRGLSTEAVAAYVDWCYESREHPPPAVEGAGKRLTRLHAEVSSGNDASMRILEKCGFKHEGVWRGGIEKYGEVYDTHFYGLTRKDWEEHRQSKGQE